MTELALGRRAALFRISISVLTGHGVGGGRLVWMPRTGLTLLSLLVGLLLDFVLANAKVLLLLLCLLRLVGDAAEEGLVSFRPRATAGPASRAGGGSTAHKAAGVGVAWHFFWLLAPCK